MLDVERWAELRREHFARGVGIKKLARWYGIGRNTVRRALRSPDPPRYRRPAVVSKLEPSTRRSIGWGGSEAVGREGAGVD